MADELTAILRRIAGELGGPERLAALEALAPRDLASLILHLLARQAERVRPADLLAQAERTSAFAPAAVDPRAVGVVVAAAHEAAAAFTAVELAPVAPLGLLTALTGLHPDNVLAAARAAEVPGDSAPLLALECARRRRDPAARTQTLRLCGCQRVLRVRPAPPPGLLPHFRLFALATAAQRGPGVVAEALREHVGVYLATFERLGGRGFRIDDVVVEISDMRAVEARLVAAGTDPATVRRNVRTGVVGDPDEKLAAFGLTPLRGRAEEVLGAPDVPPALSRDLGEMARTLVDAFPAARVEVDLGRLEGLGYYPGPCLRIRARDPSGVTLGIADGGLVRWTERLLSDGAERLFVTGFGPDLLVHRFRAEPRC